MKKLTLTLLAAFAVAGTSFAGAPVVTSKEYKQPVITPCFRDTEFTVDLFYSYNDATHGGHERDRLLADGTSVGCGRGLIDTSSISLPPGFDVAILENAGRYFRDGSGGGIGFNYFFSRYFGVGVEGNWWLGVNAGRNLQPVVIADQTAIAQAAAAAAADPIIIRNGVATSVVIVNPNDPTAVAIRQALGNRFDNAFRNQHHSAANQISGSLIFRYPIEGSFCWAPYIFGGGGGIWDGEGTGFGHIGFGAEWRVTPSFGLFSDWRWEFMANDNHSNKNDVNQTRLGVRFVF